MEADAYALEEEEMIRSAIFLIPKLPFDSFIVISNTRSYDSARIAKREDLAAQEEERRHEEEKRRRKKEKDRATSRGY